MKEYGWERRCIHRFVLFRLSQDGEVEESGDEVTGDHIQTPQTNGANE